MIKKQTNLLPLTNYVENAKGHGYDPFSVLPLGYFIFREVPIKSPICIPCHVINTVGLPDEIYAPWDDIAFCYAVSKAGFYNGVYAIDFESDVSWGTTRTKAQANSVQEIVKRNIAIFKNKNKRDFFENKLPEVYRKKKQMINKVKAKPPSLSKIAHGIRFHIKNNIQYFFNRFYYK